MLAVNQNYRKRGIGSTLASIGIERMVEAGCDEITLEAEVCLLNAFINNYSNLIFS